MKIKHIVLLLFLPVTFLWSCASDNAVTEYNNDPITNLESLWSILDKQYCYFDEKGIDWDGVYDIYIRRLYGVTDIYGMFDVFAQMLDTLQDGHVNLYTSFDISRCTGWYSDYPTNFSSSIIYNDNYLGSDYRYTGACSYQRIHDNEIGYIRYPNFSYSFSSTQMMYIQYYFRNCKGIIIDVRNNGGGSLDYSEKLASCFFKEKTLTGYIRHKTGEGHEDFSDPVERYVDPSDAYIDWSDKKVVVLCNRQSYSATNDFIEKVLLAPNVIVMGGKTGGGGGLPLSNELPNGWLIRFSAVPMYDQNMQTIEFGVNPEVFVNQTDDDTANGYDTLIEAACDSLIKG